MREIFISDQRVAELLDSFPEHGPVFDDEMHVVGFSMYNSTVVTDLNGKITTLSNIGNRG